MGRRDKARGCGRSRSRGNVIPGIMARARDYGEAFRTGVDVAKEGAVIVTQDVLTSGPIVGLDEDQQAPEDELSEAESENENGED